MKKIKTLLLFAMIGGSLASCSGKKQPVQTFERPVKLYTAESLRFLTRSYPGIVKAEQTSNLAFKMGGQLIKLNVENGQKVTKGEFIAQIDPIDYTLQLESAKAAYINSKSMLERYQRLVAKQAISQQEFESIQANYIRDKSNYENAVSMVGETKIYAPFSGIIEKRFVDNYQRVQPAEPVVKLINPSNLEVYFTLPENNISAMRNANKQFYVEFEAYPAQLFTAKVTKFVDASPDGSGVPVTVVVDDAAYNQQKYNIRPGFSCTVILKTENTDMRDVVSVPITAIKSNIETAKDSVWVYNSAKKDVEIRGVKLGDLFGSDMVVIESGLEPGEKVVSAGVTQLVNGQQVNVLQ